MNWDLWGSFSEFTPYFHKWYCVDFQFLRCSKCSLALFCFRPRCYLQLLGLCVSTVYAYQFEILNSLHILLSHCKFHFYFKATCILLSFFPSLVVEFQAHGTVLAMVGVESRSIQLYYESYNCFKGKHICWKNG